MPAVLWLGLIAGGCFLGTKSPSLFANSTLLPHTPQVPVSSVNRLRPRGIPPLALAVWRISSKICCLFILLREYTDVFNRSQWFYKAFRWAVDCVLEMPPLCPSVSQPDEFLFDPANTAQVRSVLIQFAMTRIQMVQTK
jgi:hypothetical protein